MSASLADWTECSSCSDLTLLQRVCTPLLRVATSEAHTLRGFAFIPSAICLQQNAPTLLSLFLATQEPLFRSATLANWISGDGTFFPPLQSTLFRLESCFLQNISRSNRTTGGRSGPWCQQATGLGPKCYSVPHSQTAGLNTADSCVEHWHTVLKWACCMGK